jgi:sulfatase modifying factor 1
MKTRFSKLGMTICAVLGVALFGTSSKPGGSIAYAADNPPAPAPAPLAAKIEQVHVSLGAKPTTTPIVVQVDGKCPPDMVEVDGDYCPYVEQRCVRWLDPETKMRCADFAPTSNCQSKTAHKHFCIDRFEYPNKQGEKPVVMKTWYDASAACTAEGKRLCGESEWTLACEGQERLPYPYGYARNAEACNIDKPHPDVDEAAIADPARRDAEVARLDQRDASGSREACVSHYGVFDMTGNVDEWVVNESGKPFKSGLKGGYWGPVRDRCRPMTIAHNEGFSFYQIGFRCCEDAAASGPKIPAGGNKAPSSNPAAAGPQGTVLAGS